MNEIIKYNRTNIEGLDISSIEGIKYKNAKEFGEELTKIIKLPEWDMLDSNGEFVIGGYGYTYYLDTNNRPFILCVRGTANNRLAYADYQSARVITPTYEHESGSIKTTKFTSLGWEQEKRNSNSYVRSWN